MSNRWMRVALLVAAVGGTLFAVREVVRAAEDAAITKSFEAIGEAMADRRFDRAQGLAEEFAAAHADDPRVEEAEVLAIRARVEGGKWESAVEAAVAFLDRRPKGAWREKVRFVMADAHARAKGFRNAARIYRDRIETLAAPDARRLIADQYVELALEFYVGVEVKDAFGRVERKKDFNRALQLFTTARKVLDEPTTADVMHDRIARCHFELRRWAQAITEWTAILDDHPKSSLRARATRNLGEAHARAGDPVNARKRLNEVVADFPKSEHVADAMVLLGQTYQPLSTGDDEAFKAGLAWWRRYVNQFPDEARAPDVRFDIALASARRGDYDTAIADWRAFLAKDGAHVKAPEAQSAIAESRYRQKRFDDAIAEWKTFLGRWPNHAGWTQAQGRIVEAAFQKGEVPFSEKKWEAARSAYVAFLSDHPVASRAPLAQHRLGEIAFESKQPDAAIAAWRILASKYATNALAPQALLAVAHTVEREKGDLAGALVEYEKLIERFPRSAQARAARQAIDEMKGKHLQLLTERCFTTDATPTLKATLRNVTELKLRAYRIDVETYFRRTHRIAAIEDVAVDIVAPDFEWTWGDDKGEPYRLLEREIPLDKLKGAGAWIVTAGEEDLTATTFVLVSDARLIVKQSPRQLFAFAFDARLDQPMAGARVLFADGSGVFQEVKTGKDGVAKVALKTNRKNVQALLLSGEHASTTGGALDGAAHTWGYSTKAYLYTDRPVYRPGQTVEFKGLIRKVAAGDYQTPSGEKLRLWISDSRGTVMFDREMKTNEFGTISDQLELPDAVRLGTYTIRARYRDTDFAATFEVRAYRKPEFTAEISTPSRTYLAGEAVEAKISLAYTFGGPVRGTRVLYTVYRRPWSFNPDSLKSFAWLHHDAAREEARRRQASAGLVAVAEGEAVTNDAGEASISFATEAVEQDRSYLIAVRAQDVNREWISGQSSVFVTQRDWFAVLKSDKRVYRPKEEIRAELTTVDATQQPVKAKGEIGAHRRVVRDGRVTFEPVSITKVETGEDGKGNAVLRLEKAGTYRVRFEGVDRRGGAVLADTTVEISGEAEDLEKQAKIVAEHEIYMQGDTARVMVNSPVAPALAVLTFEGENVLDYRVLRLEKRSTTLELPMTDVYSPNVFLRVAIAGENELFEDEEQVAVLEYLDVQIETNVAVAKPGEKITATVRTRDQKGQPVAAEVSLAVVDDAIFALVPDGAPQIKPFFYDQRRKNVVKTSSSLAFRWIGVTRETNKDLLLEGMRRLGAKRYSALREYVSRGRRAMQEGDLPRAVEELKKALAIDPRNKEARAVLGVLVREAEQKEQAGEELRKLKSQIESLQRYARRDAAGAVAGKPTGSPKADAGEAMDKLADRRGRKNLRAEAEADDEPSEKAEFGRAAERKGRGGRRIGVGGGAGGKFKGPGGEVPPSLRASNDPAPPAANPRPGAWSKKADGQDGLADVESQLARLGEGTAPDPAARRNFLDTALWKPSVRTDATGVATVELELPDNLTRWRLTARGIDAGALVGEGTASLVARKDLIVRIGAPRFLTQGDEVVVTSSVINATGDPASLRIGLESEQLVQEGEDERTVKIGPNEQQVFDWKLRAEEIAMAELVAKAVSVGPSDVLRRSLRVLPYGETHRVGRSGLLEDETSLSLERPKELVRGTLDFRLVLTPNVDDSLLAGIHWLETFPYACLEQTINRFLPALAASDALKALGLPDAEAKKRLAGSVERGLRAVYAFQADDGSFGWWRGGKKDVAMTAFATYAIERARLAGFAVDKNVRARALAASKRLLGSADYSGRAFLLRALALGGQADVAQLNSLSRYRDGLEPIAVAQLALAYHDLGRSHNAMQLVAVLKSRVVRDDGATYWKGSSADRRGRFLGGDVEATAWALLALVQISPDDPLSDAAASWLESRREGTHWGTTKATGAAIRALAAWNVRRKAAAHDAEVEVWWNGKLYQKVKVAGDRIADRMKFIRLDEARFRTGRNDLRLVRRGSGVMRWALQYTYVTPAKTLEAKGTVLSVGRRWVDPGSAVADPEGDGRIEEGYTIVRPEARPKETAPSTIRRAGSGDRFRVELTLTAREDLSYVIVEDPLPAGVEVVEGQATGPFDHQERFDEKQVFFLSHLPKNKTITLSYLVQAIHPGEYRSLPASSWAMYEPGIHGRSRSLPLTVVPEAGVVGAKRDVESLTPDTIWGLATRAYKAGEWEKARSGFSSLVADGKLLDRYHEAGLWHVMKCSFELGDAKTAVRSFEDLRTRNPRSGVSTRAERLALARSYFEIGEFETALGGYRSLGDELVGEDAALNQTFRALGRTHRAQRDDEALLRRSPDSGAVMAMELAVARRWFDLLRPLEDVTEGSPPRMIDEALAGYRRFVAHHPAHPEGDLASEMEIACYRALERTDDAIAASESFRTRHPASARVDDVTINLAAAWFGKGEAGFAKARALANELLEKTYPVRRGHRERKPSPYRPNATFLLGQIAHIQGEYATAVAHYRKVAGRFEDARDALAFLTASGLRMPERETFGEGKEASVRIEARHLGEVTLKLYPVDLMRLFAVRKDLSQIHRINLTGIVPKKSWTAKLDGPADDFRWREHRVAIETPGKGVFLVLAKSGGHEASAIVIQSNLELEVQRIDSRVRIYAFDRRTREPMEGVYVKVSDGTTTKAHGLTDARGVFEARDVGGSPSVVAEKDGHFALAR